MRSNAGMANRQGDVASPSLRPPVNTLALADIQSIFHGILMNSTSYHVP